MTIPFNRTVLVSGIRHSMVEWIWNWHAQRDNAPRELGVTLRKAGETVATFTVTIPRHDNNGAAPYVDAQHRSADFPAEYEADEVELQWTSGTYGLYVGELSFKARLRTELDVGSNQWITGIAGNVSQDTAVSVRVSEDGVAYTDMGQVVLPADTGEVLLSTPVQGRYVRALLQSAYSQSSEGWTPGTGDFASFEYKAFTFILTWEQHESLARLHNAHLASVHSAAENQFLREMYPTGHFWIGYKQQGADESSFEWSDGTTGADSYTNWNAGEPDNGEAHLYAHFFSGTSKWNDGNAGTVYGAVYKRPRGSTEAPADSIRTRSIQVSQASTYNGSGGGVQTLAFDNDMSGDFSIRVRVYVANPSDGNFKPVLSRYKASGGTNPDCRIQPADPEHREHQLLHGQRDDERGLL